MRFSSRTPVCTRSTANCLSACVDPTPAGGAPWVVLYHGTKVCSSHAAFVVLPPGPSSRARGAPRHSAPSRHRPRRGGGHAWVHRHLGRRAPLPAARAGAQSSGAPRRDGARTRTIRLGSAVAVVPMRPSLFTAEDYALVDAISGGRLDLGVGSGNEFELAGKACAPTTTVIDCCGRASTRSWRGSVVDRAQRGVRHPERAGVSTTAPTGVRRRDEPGTAAADVGRCGHHLLTL